MTRSTGGSSRVASPHPGRIGSVLLLTGAIGFAASCAPSEAIPEATAPSLAGVRLGAELGVAGDHVSGGSPLYYVYASAGVAHTLGGRIESLGGAHRTSMTVVSGQFSLLPLPFVTANIEPGVTWAGGTAGPSLGIRATGSALTRLSITGAARVHYLNSRATTEIGLGADFPIGGPLRGAISFERFNGGLEPSGSMVLIGVKAKLGL